MSTRRCWLVRAGEDSKFARQFAEQNAIAVGWPDVEGLADLRGLSAGHIRSLLEAKPEIIKVDADLNELLQFRDEISVGDVVVTPDAPVREVLIGQVAGGYDYWTTTPVGAFHHVRQVEWFGRLERDHLPTHLNKQTNYRRTIRLLDNTEEWFALAERVKAGEGKSPDLRGRCRTPATSSGGRRVSADVPQRLCASCGFVKAAVQFVRGDERCRDCRDE